MDLITILTYIVPFIVIIFSIILHEIAHGYVAYRFGDMTAKIEGRLTLNPIPHIDPVGTILLPLAMALLHSPVAFGWAKPVPVNYYNLRGGEKAYFWVSVAGIVVNLSLALIGAIVFRITGTANFPGVYWVTLIAYSLVFYNILLALFNLVPIPPLDGSRLLRTILPTDLQAMLDQIEPYGFVLVFLFLYLFQARLGQSVSILANFLIGQ